MSSNDLPFVSVVVPMYNEEQSIAKCLEALQAQSYPSERYEIIVVDNGSSDGSVNIAAAFDIKVLKILDVKVGGVRNFGASKAKGSVLAFIDSDCLANKHWLSDAVEKLSEQSVGGVGGGCLLRNNPSWVENGWKINAESKTMTVDALAGGSFIVHKELFDSLGGFDEKINAGEDTKLSHQIKKKGYELWFLKNCYVVHLGYPTTALGFIKREFWHASSYWNSNIGYKDKMFISILFFVFSVICLILFVFFGKKYLLFGSVFIVLSPTIFFLKNIRDSGFPKAPLNQLVSAFFLCLLYYIGRSLGLIFGSFSDPFKRGSNGS